MHAHDQRGALNVIAMPPQRSTSRLSFTIRGTTEAHTASSTPACCRDGVRKLLKTPLCQERTFKCELKRPKIGFSSLTSFFLGGMVPPNEGDAPTQRQHTRKQICPCAQSQPMRCLSQRHRVSLRDPVVLSHGGAMPRLLEVKPHEEASLLVRGSASFEESSVFDSYDSD